ncbi:hypothetical protein CAPTEDRAFT_113460, partial [Capitella teleta]
WHLDPVGRNCYFVNEETKLGWEDARAHCADLGGDLASIVGPTDQSFIETLIHNTALTFWTGGNHLYESSGWTWSDGSPAVYFNWAEGKAAESLTI